MRHRQSAAASRSQKRRRCGDKGRGAVRGGGGGAWHGAQRNQRRGVAPERCPRPAGKDVNVNPSARDLRHPAARGRGGAGRRGAERGGGAGRAHRFYEKMTEHASLHGDDRETTERRPREEMGLGRDPVSSAGQHYK